MNTLSTVDENAIPNAPQNITHRPCDAHKMTNTLPQFLLLSSTIFTCDCPALDVSPRCILLFDMLYYTNP